VLLCVATIVLTAVIAGLAVWKLKPSEPRETVRFYYDLPKEQQFDALTLELLSVSADGKQFVYGTSGGLYLRSVDELESKLITGTETNPVNPFFSPDGKWIGYCSLADGKLKKIAISGGAPVVLCDAAELLGASWDTDGTIVYAETGKGIMRVSANGENLEVLVKQTELYLVHPQILPDKKTLLFTHIMPDKSQIVVQSLKTGERKVLIEGGGTARYLPTGHLVYMIPNNLFAIPFDLSRLEVAGSPVPMVVGVYQPSHNNAPQFAVSNSGTLVYMPGVAGSEGLQRSLVWVDRKGKEEPLPAQPNDYRSPRISPDGSKVALTVYSDAKADILIWDIVRETMTRLTFNAVSTNPLWSLDGLRVAFSSGSVPSIGAYWKAADGTGSDEPLFSEPGRSLLPGSWSKDGKTLVAGETLPSTNSNIGSISMEGDHDWRPLLQERYNEVQPEISPDGRWMAYSSDESGKLEVYVRPFPEVNKGGRWQISTAGGDSPLWSRDGRELFYRNGNAVMGVAIEIEPTFKAGKPETLFQGTYTSVIYATSPAQVLHPWDISRDGKRFLMMKDVAYTAAGQGPRKINIVLNWFEELKRRVPAK
jgi:Tol biopolymer transport system component